MNFVLRVKEHPLLGLGYSKLRLLLEIVPCYLIREVLADLPDTQLQPGVGPIDMGFLDRTEVQSLAASPEVPELEDVLMERLDAGCLCLGARHEGTIAAYSWCDLAQCNYDGRLAFPLSDKEAYLFDARTFKAYRGNKLAGCLRYKLYRELDRMGRDRFFSTSSCLNTSAMSFKDRLKARRVRLYVYIKLFNKWQACILLRRYSKEDEPLCMSNGERREREKHPRRIFPA